MTSHTSTKRFFVLQTPQTNPLKGQSRLTDDIQRGTRGAQTPARRLDVQGGGPTLPPARPSLQAEHPRQDLGLAYKYIL